MSAVMNKFAETLALEWAGRGSLEETHHSRFFVAAILEGCMRLFWRRWFQHRILVIGVTPNPYVESDIFISTWLDSFCSYLRRRWGAKAEEGWSKLLIEQLISSDLKPMWARTKKLQELMTPIVGTSFTTDGRGWKISYSTWTAKSDSTKGKVVLQLGSVWRCETRSPH